MTYKLEEVFEILSSYGLTKNIQVVRRWVREEKLLATYLEPNNRKIGQVVSESDLHDFLSREAPGILTLIREKKALEDKISRLEHTSVQEQKITPEKELKITLTIHQ